MEWECGCAAKPAREKAAICPQAFASRNDRTWRNRNEQAFFPCPNHNKKQLLGQHKTLDKPGPIFTRILLFCGMIGIVRAQSCNNEREGFPGRVCFPVRQGTPSPAGGKRKGRSMRIQPVLKKPAVYNYGGRGRPDPRFEEPPRRSISLLRTGKMFYICSGI